jgi:hypothetical protein
MQTNAELVPPLPVVARAEDVCLTGTDFRLGYRPSLDGLRAVAILSVLAVHAIHVYGASGKGGCAVPGGGAAAGGGAEERRFRQRGLYAAYAQRCAELDRLASRPVILDRVVRNRVAGPAR